MCVPVMVISFVEAGTRLHYVVSKVGNNFLVVLLVVVCMCWYMCVVVCICFGVYIDVCMCGVCAHECTCMHAEAHVCVSMCVHVRGQPQVVFLKYCLSWFWRQISLTWILPGR